MMEVNSRKVWICLAKGSNQNYTGYFLSVVESINNHIKNFVACPGAQVYWWLRRRGCLAEDINRMVRHCFTLDASSQLHQMFVGFHPNSHTWSHDIVLCGRSLKTFPSICGPCPCEPSKPLNHPRIYSHTLLKAT